MTDIEENTTTLAALLVDLENLYLAVADRYRNPADLTMATLQALREHLVEKKGLSPVVGRAYAPFDYSISRVLINDLALMGITPVHVLAHATKNSADLMLAIDAMEILFRRADIKAFVIVGGDRDYIPVVERIKQNAKGILIVSPKHAMSGDLTTIVGKTSFLDPLTLLPEGRAKLKSDHQQSVPPPQKTEDLQKDGAKTDETDRALSEPQISVEGEKDKTPVAASPIEEARPAPKTMAELGARVADRYELEDLRKCMGLILNFQAERKIREVWMGPFLRVMNDAFPLKNNAERKELLNRLDELGSIQIEERRRNDEGGTYAVIVVNWQHPLAIEMNPG